MATSGASAVNGWACPWPPPPDLVMARRYPRATRPSSCLVGQVESLSFGTGSCSVLRRETELSGHPDQPRDRGGLHLLHDVPAVELDRPLGRLQLARDLLVQAPCDHESHDLPLACGEPRVALTQPVNFAPYPLRRAIALDRGPDRGEQLPRAGRLGQELDGAFLHRAYGHRNAAASRDED